MTTVPPGWYDDGHGGMRWWDGTQWTEHVAVPQTAEPRAAEHPLTDRLPSASPYWGGEPAAAGAAPPGGGAPGAAVVGEASAPATTASKSRIWIVWVVLGIILLGAVLAYLLGVSLSSLESTSGESSGEVPNEIITHEPAPVLDLTADEQAAVDTVERNIEAWLTGDCDAFFATTTAALRAEIEVTDCAVFADDSLGFSESVDDYETVIRSVVTSGETITVSTTEAYSSTYDDNGNDTGVPFDYEDQWEYTLVRSATGGWAINAVL